MTAIKKLLYSISNHSSKEVPYTVNLLKFQAITRKALREGKNFSYISKKLMTEEYFQNIQNKFGKEETFELVFHLIQNAIDKELEHTH